MGNHVKIKPSAYAGKSGYPTLLACEGSDNMLGADHQQVGPAMAYLNDHNEGSDGENHRMMVWSELYGDV